MQPEVIDTHTHVVSVDVSRYPVTPGVDGEHAMAAHGQRQLVGHMPERQPRMDRHASARAQLRDRHVDIVAGVVRMQLVFGEGAKQHGALPREHARMQQLMQHALDPVRMLADVLEKQDAAVDLREVWRADEMRHHREVAAPQRACA